MAGSDAGGIVAQEYVKPPGAAAIYDNVVFQSEFEGPNNSTAAIDNSPIGAPIYFAGTQAKITTANFKFGSSALAFTFDPSGRNGGNVFTPWNKAYAKLAKDFTYECYLRPGDTNSANLFWSDSFNAGYNSTQFLIQYFGAPNNGLLSFISSTGTMLHGMTPNGAFYHCAFCRYNQQFRIFVNGNMVFSTLFAQDGFVSNGGLSIGGLNDGITRNNGSYTIDSVRISACAWYRTDSNFTPPSAPFPAPNIFTRTLVSSSDSVYSPSVVSPGNFQPAMLDSDDIFYAPSVSQSLHDIFPPLVAMDVDSPVTSPPQFITSGALQNDTGTNGVGEYVLSPLPSFLETGALLISFLFYYAANTSNILFHDPNDPTSPFFPPLKVSWPWTIGGEYTVPNVLLDFQSAFFSVGGILVPHNIVPMVVAWAYMTVDGTQSGCEWTFTEPVGTSPTLSGSGSLAAITYQFRGVHPLTPVGNIGIFGGQGNEIKIDPFTTAHDNSLVLSQIFTIGGGIPVGATVNAPWVNIYQSNSLSTGIGTPSGVLTNRNTIANYEVVPSAGLSDPLDEYFYFQNYWATLMIELRGGTSGYDAVYKPTLGYDPRFLVTNTTNFGSVTSTRVNWIPIQTLNDWQPGDLVIIQIHTLAGNETFTFSPRTTDNNGGAVTPTSNPWTIGGTSTDANGSSCWAWKVISAAECLFFPGGFFSSPGTTVPPDPIISWGTASAGRANVFQFRGNSPTSPIGAAAVNTGTSTTLSINGVTTTHVRDMVFTMLSLAGNQTISSPANYTNVGRNSDGSVSWSAGYQFREVSGTVADNVSVAIASANWRAFMVEIKSN